MKKSIISILGSMILAGLTSIPAMAESSALPGTVNYVEGNVTLGDQALNAKSVGSETVEPGQTLVTNKGKAEMLLTPGVFLRLGDNSAVELVSGDLTEYQVRLNRGSAMIEVDELHKENDLRVADNGAMTHLQKTGIYAFRRRPCANDGLQGRGRGAGGRSAPEGKGRTRGEPHRR